MEKTKNDLSWDEVKLDYEALRVTASCAVGRLKDKVYHYLNGMVDNWHEGNMTSMYLNAQWMSEEAGRLVICAETLASLEEGLKRHNVIIVNKPEVPEEKEDNG